MCPLDHFQTQKLMYLIHPFTLLSFSKPALQCTFLKGRDVLLNVLNSICSYLFTDNRKTLLYIRLLFFFLLTFRNIFIACEVDLSFFFFVCLFKATTTNFNSIKYTYIGVLAWAAIMKSCRLGGLSST